MAAYRRVYDSRHLQAYCQEPGSAPEPYGNRVWATCTFLHGCSAAEVSAAYAATLSRPHILIVFSDIKEGV